MKVLKIFVFSISLLFSFEGMAARIGGKEIGRASCRERV